MENNDFELIVEVVEYVPAFTESESAEPVAQKAEEAPADEFHFPPLLAQVEFAQEDEVVVDDPPQETPQAEPQPWEYNAADLIWYQDVAYHFPNGFAEEYTGGEIFPFWSHLA